MPNKETPNEHSTPQASTADPLQELPPTADTWSTASGSSPPAEDVTDEPIVDTVPPFPEMSPTFAEMLDTVREWDRQHSTPSHKAAIEAVKASVWADLHRAANDDPLFAEVRDLVERMETERLPGLTLEDYRRQAAAWVSSGDELLLFAGGLVLDRIEDEIVARDIGRSVETVRYERETIDILQRAIRGVTDTAWCAEPTAPPFGHAASWAGTPTGSIAIGMTDREMLDLGQRAVRQLGYRTSRRTCPTCGHTGQPYLRPTVFVFWYCDDEARAFYGMDTIPVPLALFDGASRDGVDLEDDQAVGDWWRAHPQEAGEALEADRAAHSTLLEALPLRWKGDAGEICAALRARGLTVVEPDSVDDPILVLPRVGGQAS